ncbi:unnamed protein product [Cylicocyclus nassatus]|uniref:Uncharacterized protein n=1 Tax=Cylicocyclus nassatus TaxID=53992 RepID=A0AA36GZ00_CYLNA|nr:unnamed protein product [Cylicocyclus nassatus]
MPLLASVDDNNGEGYPITLTEDESLGTPEECLIRIGISGHTSPQFIKKELGSAGTEDPLNQRQISIGWKLDTLGYKVVNPDAVIDYMCIPTMYRVNINARPDLKNQFTDYAYGYMDDAGNYYHPEQVASYFDGKFWSYVVRGTNTIVHTVKMADLVKPIGTKSFNRISKAGQHAIAHRYCSNNSICLIAEDKAKH